MSAWPDRCSSVKRSRLTSADSCSTGVEVAAPAHCIQGRFRGDGGRGNTVSGSTGGQVALAGDGADHVEEVITVSEPSLECPSSGPPVNPVHPINSGYHEATQAAISQFAAVLQISRLLAVPVVDAASVAVVMS